MQQKFTLLFFALILSIAGATAQTVATFDTLKLSKADTFYLNYSAYGQDVGFDDGLAHFPCIYDTFPGGFEYWNYGFAYSNMTDTITSGFMNQYSAATGKGFNNSNQYLIAYGQMNKVILKGKAVGNTVNGFYITNTTYAYKSMRDGDMFAKKFGGVSGNDTDWFKVIIKGYKGGLLAPDSVVSYLADFRFADNTKDTILKGWQWVNLLPLGKVDSLQFELNSSDTGAFGMNTPAYFAMDNFSTYETNSVDDVRAVMAAKVYPNPAVSNIFIDAVDSKLKQVLVMDATGRTVATQAVTGKLTSIDVAGWTPGVYMLHLVGEGQTATMRFVKQ